MQSLLQDLRFAFRQMAEPSWFFPDCDPVAGARDWRHGFCLQRYLQRGGSTHGPMPGLDRACQIEHHR